MRSGHQPAPPRCALARLLPASIDAGAIKRRGWLEDGILVVALDDPRLDTITRQFVRMLGRKLHGQDPR